MAHDLYVTLLSPVIVRTLGSFSTGVDGVGAEFAAVNALVAKEWNISSFVCVASKSLIKGGGRL